MNTLLWLDDERNPFENNWIEKCSPVDIRFIDNVVWVKNYDSFVEYLEEFGLPYAISYDHDLGDFKHGTERTGLSCAEYLISEFCNNENLINHPIYNVHSSNPTGAENIKSYIESWHKFINNELNERQKRYFNIDI